MTSNIILKLVYLENKNKKDKKRKMSYLIN
jgi:hypothetical protein